MKKTVTLLLIIILIAGLGITSSADSYTYTLGEVYNLGIENNSQIILDNIDIRAKENQLKKALEDAEEYMNKYSSQRSQRMNYKITAEVNPMEAETNLNIARMNSEENKEKLKFDIYKAVCEIQLINKELEIEKEKLGILQEKYNITKVKLTEGNTTESELNEINYLIESKRLDIESIETRLVSANIELKKLLNLPFDDTLITIDEELTYEDMEDINIDDIIKDVMKDDLTVYQTEQNIKAKEKALEITGEFYSDGDYYYEKAEADYEIVKIDSEESRINIEVNIRNKYNDLLTRNEQVNLALKYEELAKDRLDIMNTRYELGVASKEELLSEKEKYLDAVYQKYEAICDYNIVKAEFENIIN